MQNRKLENPHFIPMTMMEIDESIIKLCLWIKH